MRSLASWTPLVLLSSRPPSEWAAHHRSYTADDAGFAAEFDTPAFARWWGAVPRDGAPRVVVNVHVDSRQAVDEFHRRALDLGAEELKAPWDAFWGARYSVVLTPGPFLLGLMGPLDPAHRAEPPPISEFT